MEKNLHQTAELTLFVNIDTLCPFDGMLPDSGSSMGGRFHMCMHAQTELHIQ